MEIKGLTLHRDEIIFLFTSFSSFFLGIITYHYFLQVPLVEGKRTGLKTLEIIVAILAIFSVVSVAMIALWRFSVRDHYKDLERRLEHLEDRNERRYTEGEITSDMSNSSSGEEFETNQD